MAKGRSPRRLAFCHLPFAIYHLPFTICHLPFRSDGSCKRVGTLATSHNRRHSGGGRELGASLDRRHGQIELGAAGLTRERDANRVEQRFPLLTRALADV